MALIDTPDVYGYTIFCDDIRHEVNGTRSFIGVYSGIMFIQSSFPVTLPKFAIAVTILQRKTVFMPNVGLRFHLPGDTEEKSSIQADLSEVSAGAVLADIKTRSHIKDEPHAYFALHGNFVLAPFNIPSPGDIKVRAVCGENIYRLGSLRVIQQPAPAAAATASQ
jgi:hypothetical protein